MGIVRMGPPEELVLLLKRERSVSVFIETGTFKGATAAWASRHFERVITIENSREYFDEAAKSYQHLRNIEFLQGDSRVLLSQVMASIREPAILWLDAHWCGMRSYGSSDQCPLIEELNCVHASGVQHHIFIDDARLFLSPPPLPNRAEQWPTIDQICAATTGASAAASVVVFEDVIIEVPEAARSVVTGYCQAANTKAWLEHASQNARNGPGLIRQGVQRCARDLFHKLTRADRS